MKSYEITYIKTGSGEHKNLDRVLLCNETKKDGTRVNNIIDAIEYFEELAADWGSYENKNAIVNIKVTEH